MRHFLALALLSGRVSEAAIATGLVSPAGLSYRLCPRRVAAPARAVPGPRRSHLAQIEEHLPALRPATDDEA